MTRSTLTPAKTLEKGPACQVLPARSTLPGPPCLVHLPPSPWHEGHEGRKSCTSPPMSWGCWGWQSLAGKGALGRTPGHKGHQDTRTPGHQGTPWAPGLSLGRSCHLSSVPRTKGHLCFHAGWTHHPTHVQLDLLLLLKITTAHSNHVKLN